MKRYLVIETTLNGNEFMHFIDLKSDDFCLEVSSLYNHLNFFDGQVVTKVYFSDTKLSNW